jgi:hypothetical protein
MSNQRGWASQIGWTLVGLLMFAAIGILATYFIALAIPSALWPSDRSASALAAWKSIYQVGQHLIGKMGHELRHLGEYLLASWTSWIRGKPSLVRL